MTENEIIQRFAKQCWHCTQNTPIPYGYECGCNSCGYNTLTRKNWTQWKFKEKKIHFINRLKYAEKN